MKFIVIFTLVVQVACTWSANPCTPHATFKAKHLCAGRCADAPLDARKKSVNRYWKDWGTKNHVLIGSANDGFWEQKSILNAAGNPIPGATRCARTPGHFLPTWFCEGCGEKICTKGCVRDPRGDYCDGEHDPLNVGHLFYDIMTCRGYP